MNITVEDLGPCKKLLRIDVAVEQVDSAFESVTREFQKQAQVPGFRSGKAPRPIIEKNFGSQIKEEVKKKLLPEAYQQALKEQDLKPVVYPEIEEIQFGRGKPFQFAATVEIQPDFELPEYKGLAAKREKHVITDADVDQALNVLRDQKVDYRDVDRPVALEDYVVINFTGTVEGKPVTDLAPASRGLSEQKDFWLPIREGSFIPGFAEALVGLKAGDHQTVEVTFPEDFVAPALVGKQGVYEVDLLQVKERVLPELNDEFAKQFDAEDLEKLKTGIRADLEQDLESRLRGSVRNQLVQALQERIQCELPESVVLSETRNVVYDIVQENQRRGVGKDALDQNKEQIFSAAKTQAADRVKISYILHRIAEAEKIEATKEEIAQRVMSLAMQNRVSPDDMVKQLKENDGFGQIRDQVITTKVVDHLEEHARIEEVDPPPPEEKPAETPEA